MPRLYCENHGREHEAATIAAEKQYREQAESVLIVKGTLRAGAKRCDRCNAALPKGSRVCLSSAFPGWISESMDAYEFTYEKQYLALETCDVAVYGAECAAVHRGLHAARTRRKPSQQPSS